MDCGAVAALLLILLWGRLIRNNAILKSVLLQKDLSKSSLINLLFFSQLRGLLIRFGVSKPGQFFRFVITIQAGDGHGSGLFQIEVTIR